MPSPIRCRSLVAALLLVCLGISACGGSSSRTAAQAMRVTPAAYMRALCGAIAPVEAAVGQVPSQPAPTTIGRKRMVEAYVVAIERAELAAAATLRSAGIPEVTDGPSVAASTVAAMRSGAAQMAAILERVTALPASSNGALAAGMRTLDPEIASAAALTLVKNRQLDQVAATVPTCTRLH